MPGMYPSSRNKSQPAASHSRATREETIVANRLDGKVVAITGGSQGIGLAIAQRFAQEGADIAFCYRSNKAGADEVTASIQKLGRKADFWNVTEADYDAVLNVNLKGLFFITQTFVKHRMQTKSGGKVINISSVHEELPFPHFTSYCASKGGVKMLTRNLSIELAPLGITINNIAP